MAEIFAPEAFVLKISAKTCGLTLTPADGMRSCLRIDLAGSMSCGGILVEELRIFGVGGVSLIKAQTADSNRRCGVGVLG